MSSEIVFDNQALSEALAVAGEDENLREVVFEALRLAEATADDPTQFREQVRWPLILGLLGRARRHQVRMVAGERILLVISDV